MKDRICTYCGSKIAFGDYCCPLCGAVPPSEGDNSPDVRSQRVKTNKRGTAAAALSTAVVVAICLFVGISKLRSFDFDLAERMNVYDPSSYDSPRIHIDSIDTDSLVRAGMESWQKEYGSLFANGISMPDTSGFLTNSASLSNYTEDSCTYDPESGRLSNRWFSLTADTKIWEHTGGSTDKKFTFSSENVNLTISCSHNDGEIIKRVSAEKAAKLFYAMITADSTADQVTEPYEYMAGALSGYAVMRIGEEQRTAETTVFFSDGDVLLRFDISGDIDDVSAADSSIEALFNTLIITSDEGDALKYYTDEKITDMGGGAFANDHVSFSVGSEWQISKDDSDALCFTQDGAELYVSSLYLYEQDKSLRVDAEQACGHFYSEFNSFADSSEINFEKIGERYFRTLTFKYKSGPENRRCRYYFLDEKDSLFIVKTDGTYEQLDGKSNSIYDLLESVKFTDKEQSGSTMYGVNLASYSVPAEYTADYLVKCSHAEMFVDPEEWTLTKKAVDTGDMSFTYDKLDGNGALYMIFAQSDLIGRYTPKELAQYYYRNMGAKLNYTADYIGESKIGEYDCGEVHLTYNYEGEALTVYIKTAKQGNNAVMVYWTAAGDDFEEMTDSINKMLDTFTFTSDE